MKKYTILFHDGVTPSNGYPEEPTDDNQAATMADARYMVSRLFHYSEPNAYADIVFSDAWDGISYGDITGGTGICRFSRGVRGGLIRKNF